MKIFMLAVNGTIVSVPYRGATFLNIKTFQTSADSRRKFPSPIGELHFSILLRRNYTTISMKVSVPYRGATFLNSDRSLQSCSFSGFPSPIGELHFSIFVFIKPEVPVYQFPSPIGELHFSILLRTLNGNTF